MFIYRTNWTCPRKIPATTTADHYVHNKPHESHDQWMDGRIRFTSLAPLFTVHRRSSLVASLSDTLRFKRYAQHLPESIKRSLACGCLFAGLSVINTIPLIQINNLQFGGHDTPSIQRATRRRLRRDESYKVTFPRHTNSIATFRSGQQRIRILIFTVKALKRHCLSRGCNKNNNNNNKKDHLTPTAGRTCKNNNN